MFGRNSCAIGAATFLLLASVSPVHATSFTTTVPGTSITLPDEYPEAGGVAFVLVGDNGNLYYQFSNPAGAFRGFNSNGQPTNFRGNPFTINDPIALDCGFSSCTDYFGGGLQQIYIRFSAYDGDTQVGGFDENDISLILNGFNVGSWSGLTTEITNNAGTQSFGFDNGFGNNTFNTGWFSSTNSALLDNILATNQTTTQVLDDDPDDNFWNFRRGNNLANEDIVTVAPGYTLEKSADKTDFLVVGETITYDYIVTNIGSVPIRDLAVDDDVIGTVSCDKTTILDTNPGGTADFATCQATYDVTQEDVDRGFVTNNATAVGTPDFGVLGTLSDDVTVNGPSETLDLVVEKSSSLTAFGNADSSVPYSITIRNDGNTTLTGFSVSDSLIPSLSCNVPDLAPTEDFTCTGSYTVQQSDVDDWAASSTTLDNTVTVNATSARGTAVQGSDNVSLDGPAIAPGIELTKTATTADYDAATDVLSYQIEIENTGNVSYPVPTITDALTGGASCPGGNIAPGASVVCTASYTVDQDDVDTGQVDNTASASVTVAGVTVSDNDDATVSAVRTTGLSIYKRLAAASPTTYAATGVGLTYEYVLKNTGNVTLLTPSVTDDLVSASCTETEIAPGASITCVSGSYSTTQDDLNDGSVTNTASASATEAGPTPNTVNSGTDQVTVPADQQPALTLTKTAPTVDAADFVEGNTVTYTFDVENTGNIDLTNATTGETSISITDDKIGTFTCDALPLNIGATLQCTADYVLTAADESAGTVVNVATATVGSVSSNQAQAQISPVFQPAITLAKSSTTASVSSATDAINYVFTVTNSGNTNISSANVISIADPLLDAAADCSAQPATLTPGASFDCTGTRTGVTQAELDAGQVDNAATASFDFTSGSTVTITSNEATASVPVIATPGIQLTKSGPTEFTAVDQTLTYTFEVENTGNVTLTEVTVTDPLIPGLSCVLTDIAPGTTDSCTGDYDVTQDDVDAEVINNTADATGIPAQGAQVTDDASESTPINPANATKSASIDKTASPASFAAVDDVITYTMEVENTGTQTLTNVVVTDILDPSFNCTIPTLAPTETSTLCTFNYTVTQTDLDAGQVDNTASAASAEITTVTDSETVTGPTRTASFDFEKIVSGDYAAAGNTLNYTFRVENTGNVTLSNVTVTDPFFGSPINCVVGTLAPGAVDNTTCTASYTVDQNDVDLGSVENTATATVDAPAGVTDPADQDSTAVSNGPTEAASIEVVKSADDGVFTSATDSEDFTFTVTNTGNVTLTNVTLTDADLGYTCSTIEDLAPGDSTSLCVVTPTPDPLQATKNFDQSDVDAGSYTNEVTVTAESAGLGTAVSDDDEVTVTGPAPAPAISLAKSTTFAGTFDAVGDTLTYEYLITNTGNITITGQPAVTDDKIASVDCPAIPGTGIAPGGTLTCTGEYDVTQADLDAGSVVNEATAELTQPIVPQNPGDDPFVVVTSNTDTETVMASQLPELRLEKRVKSTSAASYSAPTDVVTFEYVVTNIGNVTTTDPITVTDDQITGTLTCTSATVAPGASVTCEQDWVAEQADVDAGSVTNIATATTQYDSATVNSNTDSVTVNAVQNASLAIEKTFVSTDNENAFDVGDTLTYEIVVTNNGNVTIDAPITLTDNLTTPSCPAVPGGALEPGDTLVCSSTHVVTDNDIDLGSATNVVFATGSFDGDAVQSPSDDAVYPVDADPALSLTKTAQATNVPFDEVGQLITYEYLIENTGNIGLSAAITIEDDVIGSIPCKPAGPPPLDSSGPGSFFTCTEDYAITQEDLDRGFVTNNATAQTVFPASGTGQTQVVSPNADETVLADEDPELTVTKIETTTPTSTVVDTDLTYQITAENTGNQTISGVSISDPLLPTLTCNVVEVGGGSSAAPANVVLAPGDSLVCTGDYTVTQDDIDAQTLVNTATATGTDPQGVTISDDDTHTQTLVAPDVAMVVTKTIDPDPGSGQAFTDPGQELTFVIAVQNTGNITLDTATVTDDRLVDPVSCTIGPIAPGETDDSCEFTYTVTQADLDIDNGATGSEFGGFTNTASVTATPANASLADITETGSVFVRGPPQEPKLNLVKEADTDEITDDKIGTFTCSGMPAGGIAPSEFYQCTASYNVTQADVDAGFVTNAATASSSEVPDDATTSLTIDGVRTPGITITKSASPTTGVAEGETITYTYVVTNTGNVTLSDVTVSDDHTTAAGTAALSVGGDTLTTDTGETGNSTDTAGAGIWSSLGPGDAVTFTSSYDVTQDDIDEQVTITNTATVLADSPDGTTPEADASESVTLETKSPGLEITKSADATGVSDPAAVNETVSYRVEVENTGNQTLTNVVLSDTLSDGNGDTLPLTLSLTSGDGGVSGELEVGETWVYTATFTLTQEVIDTGLLSNTASVTGDDPQGEELTDALDDPVEVELPRSGSLEVAKSADDTGISDPAEVGQEVTFTIEVENTGNVTLTGVTLDDSFTNDENTDLGITPSLSSGDTDSDNELDVGETWVYTATYAITQADIDSGGLENTVTATATDPEGNTLEDTIDAPVDVALGRDPQITLVKTSTLLDGGDGQMDAGDSIQYTFTVENPGNVTLFDVTLAEESFSGTGTLGTPVYLDGGGDLDGEADVIDIAAGGTAVRFQVTYEVTQDDIDTGSVSNQASVSADDPAGNATEDTSGTADDNDTATEQPFTQDPGLEVVKTATPSLSTPPAEGDQIFYTITVENTGNVTLGVPSLTDTITAADGGTEALDDAPVFDSGDLDSDNVFSPGESWAYTASYTLTQEAIDAGGVSNTATATSTLPLGGTIDDTSNDTAGIPGDDPTVTSFDQSPSMTVVKAASLDLGSDGVASVGDVISYTYTVANTGNVSLLDVAVSETGFAGAGTAPTPSVSSGGTNIGGDAGILDLAVGASMEFTASYALLQADIDLGEVENQATGSADTESAGSVSDPSGNTAADVDATVVDIPETASLEVVKTAILTGLSDPVEEGDEITFVITAENTGNVTLSSVVLTDTFTRRDGTVLSLTPVLTSGDGGVAGELEVDETWEYRANYALTQADIDAGGVENQAVIDTVTDQGTDVSDTSDDGDDGDGNTEDDTTLIAIEAEPSVDFEKREAAGSPNPFDEVDQVILYEFDVTNTGNITLTAPISIDDPLIAGQGTGPVSCPAPPIAPGATVTCTGSYTVTQDDLDAGEITNTASVTITQPVVPVNTGDPTEIEVTAGPDGVNVPADQQPSVALDKVLSSSSPVSFDDVDVTLSYDFTVTNDGNVTLAGPITIDDDVIGDDLACNAGPLAPGASVSCTHTYDTVLADLNAGEVTNTATAEAFFDSLAVASPSDDVTVPAIQTPELTMVKELNSATPDLFDLGTVLDYSFTVSNTGNVTISGPFSINDPAIDTSSCPSTPTELLPGEEIICSGEHTLIAGNLAQGAFVNVATATGSFDGDDVTSPADDDIYPVAATPSLSIVKDSVPTDVTYAAVDDEITYTYTVTNNSSVGYTDDIFVNDNKIDDPILCHDFSELGVFGVGATATCTAVYEVTQEDLDAGEVTNEAIGATTFAPGTANETEVFTSPVTKTVPADAMPGLTLAKEISSTPMDLAEGDEVEFTMTATNSGNQTISGVAITDPLIPSLTCTVGGSTAPSNVVLAPTEALICVGTYTVTQEDIDDQSLTNTATVQGADPIGAAVDDTATVIAPLDDADPEIEVIKAIEPAPAAGQPAFTDVGDTVQFRITVNNTGNVTLNSINVTDSLTVTPASCSIGTLAPGASDASCLFTYTATQDDIDGAGIDPFGGFDNTASVTATDATPDATEVDDSDTIFVRGPDHEPLLDLEKSADATSVSTANTTINYTYVVTNAGNITLTDPISVADDRIATVSCEDLPADGLAPGASITCTASDTVTQADIDAGFVTNTASASSDEAPVPATAGDETDTVTVPVNATPALTLVKTASETSDVTVGTEITYTYTVTNSGNQTITDVSVADDHSSAAGTVALTVADETLSTDAAPTGDSVDAGSDGTWDTLRPGDVVTFTATYEVTQADIDEEVTIANDATASSTNPAGGEVTGTDDLSISVEDADPELTALKTIGTSTLSSPPVAGETVNFDITVENTGNQTISGVTLVDTLSRNDGTVIPIDAPVLTGGDVGVAGDMLPGEIWTFTASHTLTQEDVDAGGISNQVQARGSDPDGALITDASDDDNPANGDDNPTTLAIPSTPGIEAEKTITSSVVDVDETVTFEITITNTGNVTLTDVDVASDTLTRADDTDLTLTTGPTFTTANLGSGAGVLLPGEVATYAATYVLTQDDIDAGGISNSATATGTPPVGSPITDVSDDGDDSDGNTTDDATELDIPAEPAVSLDKALGSTAPASYSAVDTVIPYEFTVTNEGNVTLFAPISIDDPLITDAGGSISCDTIPATGVAPGDSVVCTGDYRVTQENIDAGEIENTATATLDGTESDPSSTTIPALQEPELTMEKTAPTVAAADFVTGAVVTYTFTTTNTGNTTVFDPITINDSLIPASDFDCADFPTDGLAPGEDYVCTADYEVTSDDVDLGSVTNIASATDGTTTSPLDDATIPDSGTPALSIEKVATETEFAEVDDVLNYTFTVTNSGTRAFVRDIVVTDTLIGDVTCFTATGSDPDFAAGETATCSGSYIITQDDLDAGEVFNEAFASTEFGADDTTVLSPADSVTTPAVTDPELTISKSAATLPVTAVDQVLTYTITVENTGNQTITSVSATDPLLDGFTCDAATLAPGATLTCDDDYTVTQDDVDAGTLSNTASVSGVNPQGGALDDSDTLVVDMPAAEPGVSITKTASPSPFGAVGSTLTYLFEVENTGNVTLSDLTVTDVLDSGYSCEITTLSPGATDATCSLEINVTQDMVDAGSLDNSASVTGTDPFGTDVDATDDVTTDGPTQEPSLEATKVALPAASSVGSVVPFVLTLENTGNVTLDNISLTDEMETLDGRTVSLDAPFALDASTDEESDNLLSPGEIWTFNAELTLTQGIINEGGVSNQVTANATDPNDDPVDDVSDNGNDTDGNSEDDPTVFEVVAAPALTVVKTVETAGAAVGDEVVFLITATNTGNVSLTGVTADDSLSRSNGDPLSAVAVSRSVPDPLDSGAVATWEVRHTITQEDIDAGGLSNSALVSGEDPDGETVSDLSADDDPTDGNTEDDPTVMAITPAPGLEVIKTVDAVGVAAGEDVTFEITVENTGNTTLLDIALTDTLTDIEGANARTLTPDFVSSDGDPASAEGTLVPGETATYTVTMTLTQDDVEAGGVQNTVTADASTPLGGTIQDVSDDDGAGDDPTVAAVAADPSLAVEKTLTSVESLFPTIEQAVFEITVENTGNVIQTGVSVTDDLASFLSPAVLQNATFPASVEASGFTDGTANGDFDGEGDTELLSGNPTLAPGEIGTITVTLAYSTAAGAPGSDNVASASSDQLADPAEGTASVPTLDTDGDGVPDYLESGTEDRDGDGIPDSEDYDPTGYFYCEENGRILSGGSISVSGGGFTQSGVGTSGPITIVEDGTSGFYQFFATAAGTYTLALTYPPSGVPSTSRTDLGTLDATTLLPTNPASIGSSEFGATGVLADFTAAANPFYLTFEVEAGDPFVLNNNIPLEQCQAAANVVATKTADRREAVFGETVNYSLSFRNDSSITYTGAEILDRLPVGLVYTPGSAVLNGTAQEPVTGAGTLSWTPISIAPAETVTLTYSARVTSEGTFGPRRNTVVLLDSSGTAISNVAAATVTVQPDAVFECSDVIGKVFDDGNFNGYQDEARQPIVDFDSAAVSKLDVETMQSEPSSEPGIAGVRLVTPDGVIVTTDEFGRFSVPCAALPRDIGSNFQLKLDTRSLPTGYRVTTENPRNIRLTAGKVAKLNFGAALGQIVRIDLSAAAFDGRAPNAELTGAVQGLLARIASEPSVIALTYSLSDGEPPETGRARLRELDRTIKQLWRGQGTYKLVIERNVIRVVK